MSGVLGVGDLDHVGIVVRSIEASLVFWRDTLGYRATEAVTVGSQGVRVVFLESGDARIELIEPITAGTGIARFLEERGRSTLHHIGIAVRDGDAALADLAARGYQLIDREVRPGADGNVAFLHPTAAGGALVELVVRP